MKKIILSVAFTLGLGVGSVMAQSNVTPGSQDTQEVQVDVAMPASVETDAAPDQEMVEVSDGKTTILINADTYKELSEEQKFSDAQIIKNQSVETADGEGVGVTLMSMCIVLLALIVLSVLFMVFGKLFARNQSKKKGEAKGLQQDHDEDHDTGETIAAIALALDEHFNSKHDLEDTVLTIRRMKRAYSPWNSKIYNMREVPVLSPRRK